MQRQLESYLYEHIPISKAMGIQVEYSSPEQVLLTAPFSNNINHKKTVFGGSLHSVATLSCWSLLYLNLKEIPDKRYQIVITKSEVAYHDPVDSDFTAKCSMPEKTEWMRFIKMLSAKGKARIKLSATISHKGKIAVAYEGIFAAILTKNPE